MADCHSLFQSFNQAIRLTEERRQALLTARNDLKTRIINGFNTTSNLHTAVQQVEFQTQGSFIMDTIINPLSEDYDLDYGVYFIGNQPRSNRPATKIFHDFIVGCIKPNNPFVEQINDKDTCVRARYKEGYSYLFENKQNKLSKGFHIDLPLYYAGSKKCPDLAHLKKSWMESDPIEFIDWFESIVNSGFSSKLLYERNLYAKEYNDWKDRVRKEDAQLRRIVRYMKAWCDYQDRDMPPGIVLTILAANNYAANSRDDLALRDTLISIHTELNAEFACLRPTSPKGEDLLEGYEHKDYFMKQLGLFVEAAKQAINELNEKRACGKWQFHFGSRFSCAYARDYNENAESYGAPAIVTHNAKSA